MSFTPKSFLNIAVLVFAPILLAQTPPTSYTIIEGVNGENDGKTNTIYRSGDKVLMDFNQPAQGATPAIRALTLMDLSAHATWSWDPTAKPIACSAGRFSGDWGDPFGMMGELNDGIKKGELKPGGTETVAGVLTTLYTARPMEPP